MVKQRLNNWYSWFKRGLDDNFHIYTLSKLRLNNRPIITMKDMQCRLVAKENLFFN